MLYGSLITYNTRRLWRTFALEGEQIEDPVLRGGLGGSYHRLFDGGHTVVGAAKAVHGADTGETIVADAAGTATALLKDAATVRGLPLTTWDKARFDAVAAGLKDGSASQPVGSTR